MSFRLRTASDGERAATANAHEDRKASGLKRMRRTATCLLAFMIALLFACVAWQADHSWLAWPRAFAEAGTIGAIADWYAVVALFRRPWVCGFRIRRSFRKTSSALPRASAASSKKIF